MEWDKSKYGIPPPTFEYYQRKAGRARGEQKAVSAFYRRIIIKGLLREMEEENSRRRRIRKLQPHSEATRGKLHHRLWEIALKCDPDHWIRTALKVEMNTLINDIKAIRREAKAKQ
jgi:hypothetical protein